MEYEVASLSSQAQVSIDTIRYYQSLGLLHPPRHDGRHAVYDDGHLERLERIKAMGARGFSLKAIAALLQAGDASASDRLLLAALERETATTHYSADDVVERLGLPRPLLAALEKAGLTESETGDPNEQRPYSEGDVDVARGAVNLLKYGFPIARLVAVAVRHDRAVRKTVDEAIDLFDTHVRKSSRRAQADPERVAQAFRDLLPAVTALVAHHFQRVLINRALKRLKQSGEGTDLQAALQETARNRLKLRWS